LPPPVLPSAALAQGAAAVARWRSFGASLPVLAQAAPAGFVNFFVDTQADGVVRAVPVLASHADAAGPGGVYESLGLAVYRRAVQAAAPVLRFAPGSPGRALLESLVIAPAARSGAEPPPALLSPQGRTDGALVLPVDRSASVLVPYRGPSGPRGGSFRYVSAADVLDGRLASGELAGRIVFVGTSAPGLQDLRTTPAGAGYPGVEIHASVVSGLLDRRFLVVPDDAPGYEALLVLLLGAGLAVGLTLLPVLPAAGLAGLAAAGVLGAGHLLQARHGLVLPQAAALAMTALAFVVNIAWGYFAEARTRRGLASLFGTYVPPQLVDRMLRDPRRYGMQAESKELTVLFCDMRGFTHMAEHMAPGELQAFLNSVFDRLTEVIGRHDGTVDKYMGDCVMAFWGAPVDQPDHAARAVHAAIDMAAAVRALNAERRAAGLPAISVGIGLNTGVVSVGDMGSARRRSYTVIGDAVNLAARLEGLGEHYGVEIVAGGRTRELAGAYLWQELDHVKVKGRELGVAIFTPLALRAGAAPALAEELRQWQAVLHACGQRRWDAAGQLLQPLREAYEKKVLYRVYAERLASIRLQPPADDDGDGAARFEYR
ncbi:MAG: adenylate/guanylate cyclase domain-containing protein, partial [Xenophilus sp.]